VDGFYGPQFRRDGGTASPLVPEEQMRILAKLRDELGIKMMEMEALVILSRAKAAGIAASLCNVAIVTREQGDQIDSKPHELADFDTRPATVIQEYMRGRLAEEGAIPWRRHNPLGRAA
jgi:uridine phosphorylase